MKESDMYLPIKKYLNELEYKVKAEVKNIDIIAIKQSTTLVVEMKMKLTLKLMYQGCDRQRLFDNVYLAIVDPGYKVKRSKQFKEKLYLLHRLRLGLILVDLDNDTVSVLFDPKEYHYRRNKKKQTLVLDEFNNRKINSNVGGVNKQKIMTAYKEQVIEIAKCLIEGEQSTKEIKKITNNSKATNILYKNYYRWFVSVERGIYKLSDLGKKEIKRYIG